MEGRKTIFRNRRTGEEREVRSRPVGSIPNEPLQLVPPFLRARQQAAEQARKEEEKRGPESFTDLVGQFSNSSFRHTSPGVLRSSQSSSTLTSKPDFGVSPLTSFDSSKPAFGASTHAFVMAGGRKRLGNSSNKAGLIGRLGSLRSGLASSSRHACREQGSKGEEKRREAVSGLSTNSFGESAIIPGEELSRIDALFLDKESDDSDPCWLESTCWKSGEAKALVSEFGAYVNVVLPKLRHAYYYIVPRLEELTAMEKAEPGYCSRVKNFVVGRYHFGSIRFMGETDVRGIDIESIIQFNNREVFTWMMPISHLLVKDSTNMQRFHFLTLIVLTK